MSSLAARLSAATDDDARKTARARKNMAALVGQSDLRRRSDCSDQIYDLFAIPLPARQLAILLANRRLPPNRNEVIHALTLTNVLSLVDLSLKIELKAQNPLVRAHPRRSFHTCVSVIVFVV